MSERLTTGPVAKVEFPNAMHPYAHIVRLCDVTPYVGMDLYAGHEKLPEPVAAVPKARLFDAKSNAYQYLYATYGINLTAQAVDRVVEIILQAVPAGAECGECNELAKVGAKALQGVKSPEIITGPAELTRGVYVVKTETGSEFPTFADSGHRLATEYRAIRVGDIPEFPPAPVKAMPPKPDVGLYRQRNGTMTPFWGYRDDVVIRVVGHSPVNNVRQFGIDICERIDEESPV